MQGAARTSLSLSRFCHHFSSFLSRSPPPHFPLPSPFTPFSIQPSPLARTSLLVSCARARERLAKHCSKSGLASDNAERQRGWLTGWRACMQTDT
eukprot:2761010-Pleurochrysis_carterae.AAC.4